MSRRRLSAEWNIETHKKEKRVVIFYVWND